MLFYDILSFLLAITGFISLLLLYNYVSTTLKFHKSLQDSSTRPVAKAPASNQLPFKPPLIPYILPYLGSALKFLDSEPGRFWAYLRVKIPRHISSCSVYLAGQKWHVVLAEETVQMIFKTRGLDREGFNKMIVVKAFGMPENEYHNVVMPLVEFEDIDGLSKAEVKEREKILTQHGSFKEFLLSQTAVNKLTHQFGSTFHDALETWKEDKLSGRNDETLQINLYAWLRKIMFQASTTALFGTDLLQQFPDFADEYFVFDAEILTMLYGIPRFLSPRIYQARDNLLRMMNSWLEKSWEDIKEKGLQEPLMTNEWDAQFGAQITKVREMAFVKRGVTLQNRSRLHLGFMFGLSSNAIPTVGWMMMHILSPTAPSDLHPRIMAELRSACSGSGVIDIAKLLSLPLLQSVFNETLRLYTDALITREVTHDTVIDGQLFEAGTNIMVPTMLHHREHVAWAKHHAAKSANGYEKEVLIPPAQFYAERFIFTDPDTGKKTFSTTGTSGRFIPFGGGDPICPGRVFAKQEILFAVASLLLTFDFEYISWIDRDGKTTSKFPKLGKSLNGSGIVPLGGDIRVKMTRAGQRGGGFTTEM